jgi:hypothetical protein
MESNTQTGQEKNNFEFKEFVGADQFKGLLKDWLSAMEQGKDLVVKVKGKECTVPKEAFLTGKFRSEYELDDGEYEFELQLKWRNPEQSTKQ